MAPTDPTRPRPRHNGMAGGFFLAASLIGGVVIGIGYRQPTIGFLAGLGVGLLLIALVWLADLRRRLR